MQVAGEIDGNGVTVNEKKLPNTVEMTGTRITSVQRESTAANLGLQPGDLLVSVAGRMALRPADVTQALRGVTAGQPVRAHWIRGDRLMYRDGRAQVLTATGTIVDHVVLGARMGERVCIAVTTLADVSRGAEPAWSGFQRAVLDWSTQAADRQRTALWGGVALGSVAGVLGMAVLHRMNRPRALPPGQNW